jgi:hypothetical protein
MCALLPFFIALIMEAVFTSEASVYSSETTLGYIPQGFNRHEYRGFKTECEEIFMCVKRNQIKYLFFKPEHY